MRHRVAIDIGGTFTDLVLETEDGSLHTSKALSTPPNLVEGVLDAVAQAGVELTDVEVFVHGTTQGLNALLERRGANVALVTTAGFRDTYLIGRGHRPDMYNLRYKKPDALLDRAATFEVRERLDATGAEIEPVDIEELAGVAAQIKAGEYEAVAVCLLHSYLNADHEKTVVAELERLLPGVSVVASHAVAPEWREYERTSTTVMSAYITPIMRKYLETLERTLREAGLKVPVYINESNGGAMVARLAAENAVGTLLSGPVGGVIGTAALSDLLGEPDMISADVGGTSFDVSIVKDSRPALRSEFEMSGLPVLAPSVEVHTIGAGGGSLISADANGRLRVGPESAGAVPGPAAYGRGALLPAVTDAHVVLGHLPLTQQLAGNLALDGDAARAAMTRVGEQLGLDAVDLAEQSLQIVNYRMAEAIRELTIERGLDPRSFVLAFFGGAGGLHAADVADELEITRVVIPALPGSFSAVGMLKGGIRHDIVRSFFRSQDDAASEIDEALEALRVSAVDVLTEEGIPVDEAFIEFAADVRYVGQEYSMTIPVAPGADFAAVVDTFQDAYQARYGHSSLGAGIELVTLRCSLGRPFDQRAHTVAQAENHPPLGEQSTYFNGEAVTVPIYHRDGVIELEGPALILEKTSTTVVPPGWSVKRLPGNHLMMQKEEAR